MFKDYLSVTKILIKNSFRRNNTDKKKAVILGLVVFGGLLPLILMLIAGAYQLTPKAVDAGIFKELLVVIITASQFTVFFFGIFSIIAYMFFSDDAEFLAALPVNKQVLFTSKLTMVYINELIVSAAILIPMLFTMGISAADHGYILGAGYFPLALLAVLLMPMIPLLIVSLLAFPMMYVVSFFKKRAVLSTVVIIILFVIFMGSYFNIMGGLSTSGEPDPSFEIGETYILLFQNISRIVFFNSFYVNAMLNIGNFFINIGLFLLVLSASLTLTIIIASMLYQGSVMAQLEVARDNSGKGRIAVQKDKAMAFFIKDFKMLIRNPGFAVQSFLGPLLTPLLILFIGKFMQTTVDMPEAEGFEMTSIMMTGIIYFFITMMLCGTNYVASVAFTREGKFFYFNKYLPIPYKDLIKGKMYFSVGTGFVGVLFSVIIYAITVNSNIINLILLTGVVSLLTIGFSYMGIYRDLRKPKLDWNNVQEAVKQNLNAMFPMFFGSIIGIGVGIFSAFIERISHNEVLSWAILWIIAYIPSIIILIYYKQKLELKKIDLINRIEC